MLLPALRKSFAEDNAVPAPGLLKVYIVQLEFDATVNDSISITVEEVEIPETITYTLTGASEIVKGYSQNYTASKLINGTADPNAVFNFSIDYLGNSSSIATLTIISNTQCSIKANSATYYINLIAEDTDTLETVTKQNIKLKNLF